jgi:hypothetical protein
MAIMTIRSTYALDVETVRTLDDVARRWRVSKSEALRRAIHSAAAREDGDEAEAIGALTGLQESLDLSATRATALGRRLRRERRASSEKRESGL